MILIPKKNGKDLPFLITISYLITFILIRLLVFIVGAANSPYADIARQGMQPDIDFYIGSNLILFGYHIHHFYFGILLICIAGWIAIVGSKYVTKQHTAIMYGTGLSLFIDEIGLLLTWGDYYSHLTYVLSSFIIVIFLNIVFFHNFWKEVRNNLGYYKAHTFIWESLFSHRTFLKVADIVSEKTGKAEKTSLIFIGIIYLFVGILILRFPQFVYYWVAGVFFIQGVTSLVRAWQKNSQ